MNESKSFLAELEENLVLIPVAVAVILTLISVVMKPFASEEATATVLNLSYYAYGWIAALCLGYCARERRNLKVSLMLDKYSASVRKALTLFNDIVMLVVMVGMLYGVFRVIGAAAAEGTMNAKAPSLPMVVAYYAPVAGFVIGIIRQAVVMFRKEEK